MKKICIVTNYRKTGNYGALLQAYALNKYFTSLNYYCRTLNYEPIYDKKKIIYKNLCKPIVFFDYIMNRILRFGVCNIILNRKKVLNYFRDNLIPHTCQCSQYDAAKIADIFDILICGSDQIWRPGQFTNEFDNVMWLNIFSNKKVKISYAASIGIKHFDAARLEYARVSLQSFQAISVREDSAVDLLQPLCNGKKIEKVLDPVFLLEKKIWDNFSKQSKETDKYILIYFINPDICAYYRIKKLAREKSLRIIYFPYMAYKFNLPDYLLKENKILSATPQEFIGYIKSAEYIFTDSFHMCAFSIIMHKNFFVCITNHATRLESLLNLTGLEGQIVKKNDILREEKISDQQWKNIDGVLKVSREKSIKFLENALSGINNGDDV